MILRNRTPATPVTWLIVTLFVLNVVTPLSGLAQTAGDTPTVDTSNPSSVVVCRRGLPTINKILKSGLFTVEVIGDGTTTARSKVVITSVLTGQYTTTDVPTFCISPKSKAPPPTSEIGQQEGAHYKPSGKAPSSIVNIVETSQRLDQAGRFNQVIFPHKQQTIAQMSIWSKLAGTTGRPEDKVTESSVSKTVYRQANMDPSSLSSEQRKEVDKAVVSILLAVDLTLKESGPAVGTKPHDRKSTSTPDLPEVTGTVVAENSQNEMDSQTPETFQDTTFTGAGSDAPGTSGAQETTTSMVTTGSSTSAATAAQLICCVPIYMVFKSFSDKYQNMMVAKDTLCSLPATAAQMAVWKQQVLASSPALFSKASLLPQSLPPLPPQPLPSSGLPCCITAIKVVNDAAFPAVYQLVHENPDPTKRELLYQSIFIPPGANIMLYPPFLGSSCYDIESFVSSLNVPVQPAGGNGVIGNPQCQNVYHYCCQGSGYTIVNTQVPTLKTFYVWAQTCYNPITVAQTVPPATPTTPFPSKAAVVGLVPPTAAPPAPAAPTAVTPTTVTPTVVTPTAVTPTAITPTSVPPTAGPALPGTPPAAAPGTATPLPLPVPSIPGGSKSSKKPPDQNAGPQDCQIKTINLANDYQEPVVYEVYSAQSSTIERKTLARSKPISNGVAVSLNGQFGHTVRISAYRAKDCDGSGKATAAPISDLEFSCSQAGEESTISDYDAFKHVTIKSGI